MSEVVPQFADPFGDVQRDQLCAFMSRVDDMGAMRACRGCHGSG